jgi:hypothetical protein
VQYETRLVVYFVSARNPESLTRARVEAISNYDFAMQGLLGSMSVICFAG